MGIAMGRHPAYIIAGIKNYMKRFYLLVVIHCFLWMAANAQMHTKRYAYDGFVRSEKNVPALLDAMSSPAAKQHPEYGYLPYNAQCNECVELIDKRTMYTREFVDPKNPKHKFNQSSYFPLHFWKDDKWITINPYLSPVSGQGEVYAAVNQPVPTYLNITEGYTAMDAGFEFKFNQGLASYYLNNAGQKLNYAFANYSNRTVGSEGMKVKNIWPGLDMKQTFRQMEVETDYLVPKPLQIPAGAEWLVIEDHFTLQDGYTVASTDLQQIGKAIIKSDLSIMGPHGGRVAHFKVPVFYDNTIRGTFGHYEVTKSGNYYTCKMFVPVNWLCRSDNLYPLTLDPLTVADTLGAFDSWAPALTSAAMRFTNIALGSCDYKMTVTLPSDATITNTLLDIEYRNTYNPLCDHPDTLWQGCRRDEVTMEMLDSICGNTTGTLTCLGNSNDTTSGTCTTNEDLVPGAGSIPYPNLLNCINAQCDPLDINFTLKNRSLRCPETCDYVCAKGNLWMVTIEYVELVGSFVQDRIQVCAGEPVTFTAGGQFGVAPYHYQFTVSEIGRPTYDTIPPGGNSITIYPEDDVSVICVVLDTCNFFFDAGSLDVIVTSSPPADAGGPFTICQGGIINLGGNPTTSAGASIQWFGSSGQVFSWLSGPNTPNPTVTVPAGTVDSFYYVVRTQDFQCFRTDTAWVYSIDGPTPVIDSLGTTRICNGQSVGLTTTQPFAAYAWNNGANTQATAVSQPGSYYVVVTDANGCTGTSNSIAVSQISVPDILVYPDTLIFYGDSVALYTNANFAVADSFFWYPDVDITCTNCVNPLVAPTVDRYYGLVMYDQGCRVSDSALIRVILPTNFFIPNAFTPNGDGTNDEFFIFSQSGVEVRDFKVFNRWGEKVHDSVYAWDGNFKGKPAPQGVYVYVFQLGIFGDLTDIQRKGSVTLIR